VRINRQNVYEKYDKHCAYCGNELENIKDMQIDHIISKEDGGTDDFENLNPSCYYCNNYKGSWTLEEFRRNLLVMLNEKNEYLFKSKGKMQIALNTGCISITKWDGIFYFERSYKND
jgi:5-methylcytosine-specific restriction endonuclease McrA